MKAFGMLSRVLAVAGILLMIYSFLGRFIDRHTVFGYLIPNGMSASSAMIGANTLLLLAILAFLYRKE